MQKLILVATAILLSSNSFANTLFEGWFEIYKGDTKIGYAAQRYEFVEKEKKFKVAHYLSTRDGDTTVIETIKGVSDDKLSPVSYTYSSQVGNQIKLIEGSVKNGLLTIKKTDGTQKVTDTKKLKPGVFLSSMLMYVMMQNGFEVGKSFTYFAIAEEDGAVREGSAFIQKKEKVQGLDALKVLNKFKTDVPEEEGQFYVFVTPQGRVLLLRSPKDNLDVRFVTKREDAVKGFEFDRQHLKIVFGDKLPLEGAPEQPKKAAPEKAADKAPEKNPAPEEPTKNQ